MSEPYPKMPLVCDTSVLLYLGRIGRVELLQALFAPIYIPQAVAMELDMGRLLRSDTLDPHSIRWATIVPVPETALSALPSNRLGVGECSVIAYARICPAAIAGLDDRQARELAELLGLSVVGTLGIVLRAKRFGLITAVHPLVTALIDQGFRLSRELYKDVLNLANETS